MTTQNEVDYEGQMTLLDPELSPQDVRDASPDPAVEDVAPVEAEGTSLEATTQVEPSPTPEPETRQGPTPEQRAQWQRQGQEQQRMQQLEAELAQTQEDNAIRQYMQEAEAQGADEASIQRNIQQFRDGNRRDQDLQQREQGINDYQALLRKEQQATLRVAKEYSKIYGIPIADLLDSSTPEKMEILGLKYQAKHRGQAQPTPTYDNNRPAPTAVNNEDYWQDQYNAGSRKPEAVAAAKRAATT